MVTYNFLDRTGQAHGRLTVIGRSTKHKRTYWDCSCLCGNYTTVRGDHLKEGRVTSCGCVSMERITDHGMARSPEYHSWQALRDRCNNPKNKQYHNYGGRGITVCKEWDESFKAFFSHMGNRTSPNHSIDRMNNDGNYEPGNCRWATDKEQVDNRRNSIIITIDGESLCLKDWCRKLDVSYSTVRNRIAKGKSAKEALGI